MPKRIALPATSVGPLKASTLYLPDLWAQNLNITAHYGTGKVDLSATVQNIGLGSASGPFTVTIWAYIGDDNGEREISQSFEVPASVTLYGKPVLEMALNAAVDLQGPFRHSYVTPPMEIPLEFIDVVPHATYLQAGLLITIP